MRFGDDSILQGRTFLQKHQILKGAASDRGREAVVMSIYCHCIHVDTNREMKTNTKLKMNREEKKTNKQTSKISFLHPSYYTDKNASESNKQLHFVSLTLDNY